MYLVASDVLGRLVEVVSGQRLDEFFAEPAEDLAAMLFTQLMAYGVLPCSASSCS